MNDYFDILLGCPLFAGSDAQAARDMLGCLSARQRTYPAHATIFAAGEETYALGVVLEGCVDVVQEDFWGNQSLMARLAPGQLFAESFALTRARRLPVSIVASQASVVTLLNYDRMLHKCNGACPHHERLVNNLLSIITQKNIYLTQKMGIITKKTIRERVLAYLSAEAKQAGDRRFSIPYDRQALADYLAVDRSALSRTLGEMKREGVITFEKNVFELRG